MKKPAKLVKRPTQRQAKARPERAPAVAAPKPAEVQAQDSQNQYKLFERATRLFHARKFGEAKQLFQEAMAGPNREVAHRAELHVRMCEQRLKKSEPELKTAEDHYNYGVALANSGELQAAQRHLETALSLDNQADHAYYALALCRALGGDLQGAYENLKRAIELQPRNRITARQDADFAAFIHRPPLDRLLFPESAVV